MTVSHSTWSHGHRMERLSRVGQLKNLTRAGKSGPKIPLQTKRSLSLDPSWSEKEKKKTEKTEKTVTIYAIQEKTGENRRCEEALKIPKVTSRERPRRRISDPWFIFSSHLQILNCDPGYDLDLNLDFSDSKANRRFSFQSQWAKQHGTSHKKKLEWGIPPVR